MKKNLLAAVLALAGLAVLMTPAISEGKAGAVGVVVVDVAGAVDAAGAGDAAMITTAAVITAALALALG